MRLTCPSCAAEYEIDSGAIGESGRKVRCASCATEWFQAAPVASVAEAAAAVDAAAKAAARERETRRETGRDAVLSPESERAFAAPEPPAIEGDPAEEIHSGETPGARNPPGERRRLGMEPDELVASLRADEDVDHGPRAGTAFLTGFATVAVLALILILIYVKRAEIADLVPETSAPLVAYADLVDQARAALARLVGG